MLAWVINILLLLLLSTWGYLLFKNSAAEKFYWWALGAKISAGLLLGLLYFSCYGYGDTLNYHQDAMLLAELAKDDFSAYLSVLTERKMMTLGLMYGYEPRAFLTTKIFSFFYLVTASNYWLASAWISLLTFLSLFWLVHRLSSYLPDVKVSAVVAFLFFPSFVFWSSGLLKESIAIFCISFVLSASLPLLLRRDNTKWWQLVLAIPLAYLLFRIKYYYAAILLPILLSFCLVSLLGKRFRLSQISQKLIFFAVLGIGLVLITQQHPNLRLSRIIEVWVDNYYLMAEASGQGSYVVYKDLKPEWWSILKHTPKAVFAGLFLPIFNNLETFSFIKLLASIENLILFLLSFFSIYIWIVKLKAQLSLPALALCVYVFLFAVFIGIASPNYGTLLRYRVSYLPLFLLLILGVIEYYFRKQKSQKGDSY